MSRFQHIDNIRAIAILLIVLGHSIILYSSEWHIMHTDVYCPLLDLFKSRIINPFQLNIFFAISGYLFYYSKLRGGQFFKKKARRLLVPYVLIAFFWMNPIKYLLCVPGYSNNLDFLHSIKGQILMSNGIGHLWFLPTLFGIFVLSYLIHSRKHSFVLMLTIGVLLQIVFRAQTIPSYFQMNSICEYMLPFAIGYSAHQLKHGNNRICMIVALTSFLACIFFPQYEILFVSSFLFAVFNVLPNKTNKILENISKNSYGIYLFHSPLIYITFTYFSDASPVVVVAINFFIFGIVAYLMTTIIRKTPMRIMIGETKNNYA